MRDWRTCSEKKSLMWFSLGSIPPASTPGVTKSLTFCNLHSNKCETQFFLRENFNFFLFVLLFFGLFPCPSLSAACSGRWGSCMGVHFCRSSTCWAASAAEAEAVPSVLAGFFGSQAQRISVRHQRLLIEGRADLLTWRMVSHPERKSWRANGAEFLPQGCPLSLTVLSRCLLWPVTPLTLYVVDI